MARLMDAGKAVYYVGLLCLVLGLNIGYFAGFLVRLVTGAL
jgi:hypothetical protein